MMELFILILFLTAMGFSLIASYFDLKTGEIPDKFTIGLVIVALAMRVIFSGILGDINFLIDGVIVGALFFGFGALLFYTGGWGGGDAKLIAGIGVALGGFGMAPTILDSSFTLLPAFFGFFISLSFVAIPYSLLYALILSIRTPKVFSLTKEKIIENWLPLVVVAVASVSLVIILRPWDPILTLTLISPPIFFLLMLYVKTVEKVAMQKEIPLKELMEGDMVVEDLVINGKKLASKRDMDGLSKEALEKILKSKNAPKKVAIKWGIRFAPAFPLALVISPFWTIVLLALF